VRIPPWFYHALMVLLTVGATFSLLEPATRTVAGFCIIAVVAATVGDSEQGVSAAAASPMLSHGSSSSG
jgi:hypothetical protein